MIGAVLAGCGSDAPPPPGEPIAPARLDDGTEVGIDRRQRRLRVGDETAAAGFGPTDVVVGDDDRIYVVDEAGGAILLFRRTPELRIVRRAALGGRPSAAVIDRERGRLYVTIKATDEVVELTADGAPRVKRRVKRADLGLDSAAG